jgi:nucleotide-binding universal stress UspA family protein
MTAKKQKKILLAVDGSDRSFETVRYVAKIPPFNKMQVVLFYVYRGVPQNYSDLGKAPEFKQSVTSARAWEAQQKEALKEHSKKVTQILLNAGFPKEAVSVKIRHRKKGIARDIIKEAHEGYDFIVVGRKSTGKIREIALGSVATKLVEKISFNTLVVVGKSVEPGKVLLALDGSKGSMQAVDCVCATLGDCEVCETELVHVIREDHTFHKDSQKFILKNDSLKEDKKSIRAFFDEAKSLLIKAGFESDQISTEIITDAYSRAGAIVQEAEKGDYGTIVVARKGLSKVRDFFIGRVSNKIIQLARKKAVWVVT